MGNIEWLLIPSISAISIKLLILWYGRKSLATVGSWTIVFFVSLFCINCLEIASFVFKDTVDNKTALAFLIFYYFMAVLASCSFSVVCSIISNFNKVNLSRTLLFFVALSVVVLLVPNGAVIGVKEIGYSITRIPGPLYWVLQIIIPGSWLLGFGILICTLANQKNSWFTRRRAFALIIASAPTVISVVGVIILMFLGFKINATVVVSFALNILLAVLFYTEYKHRLFRFLSAVPTTKENRLFEKFVTNLSARGSMPLREVVKQFEITLIQECLNKNKNNKSIVAEKLGFSRATLNRKIDVN